MRKTKEEKAITLIALIITIIVLLVLAVVAINAVKDDGIMDYATNARYEYKFAQEKEELELYMMEWKIAKWQKGAILSDYMKNKYGNRVQESQDGKVVIITDNGNSFGVNENGNIIESEDVLLTVEQLEELYTFSYYDSLSLAISDANNLTIANANSNQESAVAGIYKNNGIACVVLMQDTIEDTKMILRKSMTINLGGHVLLMEEDTTLFEGTNNREVTINIDGRLDGSEINIKNKDGACIIDTKASKFNINGGIYNANSSNGSAFRDSKL